MENRKECDCKHCQNACTNKPGWFLPEDINKVTEFLQISEKELFTKYLLIDYFENNFGDFLKDVFVLSPATTQNQGEIFPYDPRGECIFFDTTNKKCKIYSVAPFECREYMHNDNSEVTRKRHVEIAKKWNTEENQKYLKELYGQDLNVPENDGSCSIFNGF